VSSAMKAGPPSLDAGVSVAEAQRRVMDSDFDSWPVFDRLGLAGMVRGTDLASAVAAGRGEGPLRSLLGDDRSANGDAPPHVHSDHPLSVALSRMGATNHTVLPVVSRANVRLLLGVVTLPDILRAYGVDQPRDVPVAEDEHDE